MQGMASARRTEFFKRQFLGGLFSVFRRRVIFALTLVTSKSNDLSHVRNLPRPELLENLCNNSRANRPTAFADGEL
jgi:hypothetical protein